MFSKIKMKYKIAMVIVFPMLVFLGIIGKFLWDDYTVIQKMVGVKKFTDLGHELNLFIRSLREANGAAILYRINPKENSLQDVRNKMDQEFVNIKNVINGFQIENENEKKFITSFQALFENVNELVQKRTQIDNLQLNVDEIENLYTTIEVELIQKIAAASNSQNDLEIKRMFDGIIDLMWENQLNEQLRAAVGQALFQEKIIQSDKDKIRALVAKKDIIRILYYDLENDSQKELYANFLKDSNLILSNKIINNLLDWKEGGKFDVSVQQWWDIQTARIYGLNDVLSKLWEEIYRQSEAAINEKISRIEKIVAIIIVTILLTCLLTFISLRVLTKRLQEEVEILTSAGDEIQNSIVQASSGIAETATAVNETTTTVEELKQTAQLTADKAKNVAAVSDQALETLKISEHSLSQTIDEMKHIQEGMETISDSIIKLSEHSKAIGEIINTVNDLAEQSHILAVNAAIEAAKAGDQGKGFTVVSQEVRSLANQSKQATIQIRNILSDIQNSTNAAVMATEQGSKTVVSGMKQSEQTNESIRALSQGVGKVIQSITQISISSQQQLVGVDQVTIAMGNINEASNQQVEHIRQIETAIVGMNNVASNLKDLVKEYKF